MVNKDNQVRLSRHKDVILFGDLCLRTADNDTLRYYIYTPIVVDAGDLVSKFEG